MPLEAKLEAILFWRAEPVEIRWLAQAVGEAEGLVKEALGALGASLASRGLRLIRKDDEIMLGTAPEASELVERLAKEELSRDLSRASLETLTIVLYKGPLSRAEIDYIRGVNSSYILRHLAVRGLVERAPNPQDARRFFYRPTFELLQHLGISRVEDLPEYGTLVQKVNDFLSTEVHDH